MHQKREKWFLHLKRKGTATLLLTPTPDPSKKGVVRIEGSKILEFIQKPKDSEVYLGFASIFIAQPEILEYSGKNLTTTKIKKIHSKEDLIKS